MKKLGFFFCILLLSSCSSNLQELRNEGEAVTSDLLGELVTIQRKEDLLQKLPKLQKKYYKLAKLLYRTHLFVKENPEIGYEEEYPSHKGYLLYREHVRILELPGAKELLQECQKPALSYLEERLSPGLESQ